MASWALCMRVSLRVWCVLLTVAAGVSSRCDMGRICSTACYSTALPTTRQPYTGCSKTVIEQPSYEKTGSSFRYGVMTGIKHCQWSDECVSNATSHKRSLEDNAENHDQLLSWLSRWTTRDITVVYCHHESLAVECGDKTEIEMA